MADKKYCSLNDQMRTAEAALGPGTKSGVQHVLAEVETDGGPDVKPKTKVVEGNVFVATSADGKTQVAAIGDLVRASVKGPPAGEATLTRTGNALTRDSAILESTTGDGSPEAAKISHALMNLAVTSKCDLGAPLESKADAKQAKISRPETPKARVPIPQPSPYPKTQGTISAASRSPIN